MTLVLGKFHHGDGSYDFAIAESEAAGDEKGGYKVVVLPETGQTETHHNVPQGTGDGEFSS